MDHVPIVTGAVQTQNEEMVPAPVGLSSRSEAFQFNSNNFQE